MPFSLVKQQVTFSKIHLLALSPHWKLKSCFSHVSTALWVTVPLNESPAGADGIYWYRWMRKIQVVLAHCSDGWSLVLFILLWFFFCLLDSESCFSSVCLWAPRGRWGTLVLWAHLHSWHFPVLMQGSPGRNHEGNVELQHFVQVVFCILHFFSAFFAYFNSATSVKKKKFFH